MSNFSDNEIKIFTNLGLTGFLQREPPSVYKAAISLVFSKHLTGPHVEALRRGYNAAFVACTVERRTFEFENLIEFGPKRVDKIRVNVLFRGVVEICVPVVVPSSRRRPLAEKLAICRLLATTDNPDAPEDVACYEYAETFDLTDENAASEWLASGIESVAGTWSIDNVTSKE